MLCLFARLEPIEGKQLTTRVEEISDRLWRADGGRDGTPNDIRTPTQRRADALIQLSPHQPPNHPHNSPPKPASSNGLTPNT